MSYSSPQSATKHALRSSELAQDLAVGCHALQLDVPLAQQQQLLEYLNLLAKWNGVYNLTALRDPAKMLTHHLLDSLAVVSALDALAPTHVLDVGSGGGLPGVVLAIVRPDWQVTLNDVVQKKTAFQTQVKAELKLPNLQVVGGRIEQQQFTTPFDVIISRAFAELSDFVNLAGQHLHPQGYMVAMKGVHPSAEIDRLPAEWPVQSVRALTVPQLQAERHLIFIQKT